MNRCVWYMVEKLAWLSCFFGWPLMTAIVWRLALVPLKIGNKTTTENKRIIVLNKLGGTDDIIAAYKNSLSDIEFFLLRRTLVRTVFNRYLENKVQHWDYINKDPRIEESKKNYCDYLIRVIYYLNKLWSFSAIISFNVVYAPERELAKAMSKSGIAFIVLHKECVKTESQFMACEYGYQNQVGPYTGSKICVYNQAEKESMVKGNLALPEQIAIVGAPRLDYSHEIRKVKKVETVRKIILYYSIFEQAGLPYLDKKWVFDKCSKNYKGGALNWQKIAMRTCEGLVELARENPHIQIIFKVKQGYIMRKLGSNTPNNIECITEGLGHNLLFKADVVVGLNSTALIEAIASGKPVVTSLIGIDQMQNSSKFLYDMGSAEKRVYTKEELKFELISQLGKPPSSGLLTKETKAFLDRFVGNSDGMAGARLRNFISETIHVSK